jgi:sulfite exporter TauE/SafE
MAELEIHHEGHESDPVGKTVGVIAAVLAVFLAIVTIASHRTHTAAIMHKSDANDIWAHYQASRLKLHSVEQGLDLMEVIGAKGGASDKMRTSYEKQKTKYDNDSKKLFDEANGADESSKADENRALRYDIGEGLLEIGLVLSSLYFIARKKMFPVMGVIAGVAGTAIAITGLMV